MPLNVPDPYLNFTLTISNSSAGTSAKSTISQGMRWQAAPDQTILNRVSNIWRDALKPLWDNSWSVGPTHFVWNDGGTLHVGDDTTTEAGTAVSSVYTSPAIALVVSKVTGILGKRNRGRFYVPGLAESDVDEGGTVLAGSVTARQTIFNTLFTDLIADSAISELVVLHDVAEGELDPTPMTGFLVRPTVGTMRPRQRR